MAVFRAFSERYNYPNPLTLQYFTLTTSARGNDPRTVLAEAHTKLVRARADLDKSYREHVFLNDAIIPVTQQFHGETVVTLGQEYAVAPEPVEG